MSEKGLIHIYCGNGKGKTTAAVGLAIRCAGGGGKVLFFQFLKDNSSGERNGLNQLNNIHVLDGPDQMKFTNRMDEREKADLKLYYIQALHKIQHLIEEDSFQLLIMDEILPAISGGFLNESDVIGFLKQKPMALEVVLTGRNPSDALVQMADYVSSVEKIKHPYEKGIGARKLIEY